MRCEDRSIPVTSQPKSIILSSETYDGGLQVNIDIGATGDGFSGLHNNKSE